ncbi:MAG: hypothetical protein ACREXX_03240, partial [Gammaproteobacteria bacterium]
MFWTLLMCHFVADYPLQTDAVVQAKKRLPGLLWHVTRHHLCEGQHLESSALDRASAIEGRYSGSGRERNTSTIPMTVAMRNAACCPFHC